MSSFVSVNVKLFTHKSKDYSMLQVLNLNKTFYKSILNSVDAPCVIRKCNLVDMHLDVLENENDIDKRVDHPNIIKIFASFIETDFHYTVLPLAENKSVDILCRPFGLDETLIAFVLLDILKAVDYLHRNDIIHRAIKGEHVLIFGNPSKQVRFVLTGLKYSHYLNSNLKTFDYPKNAADLLNCLAPEILEQNILGYTFKADIYSIGILCCELANGVIPFDNMNPEEKLFYKTLGDIPKPFDSTCEEMAILNEYFDKIEVSLKRRYQVYMGRKFQPSFLDLTHACLHVEPLHRPTAEELLKDRFIQTQTLDGKSALIQKLTKLIKK